MFRMDPQAEAEVVSFQFDRVFASKEEREPDLRKQEEERKRAYEEAVKAGERLGYEAGMQKAREVGKRLQELLNALDQYWVQYCAEREDELPDLVFRIAERVISHEIQTEPQARTAILSSGLSMAGCRRAAPQERFHSETAGQRLNRADSRPAAALCGLYPKPLVFVPNLTVFKRVSMARGCERKTARKIF